MDRMGVLNEIYAGRAKLEAVLAGLTPAQMTEKDLPGGWSIKDLLAHLGWWEQRVVEFYQIVTRGESPDWPMTSAEVEAINARTLAQFQDMDLDAVRSFERSAYQGVLELVETIPEADLFEPQRFLAFTRGEPFKEWIVGNSSGHYEEHWSSLGNKLAR